MREKLRLCLRFLSIIRYWLLIETATALSPLSPRFADWIGERSGLNDALQACLAEFAKREAGSEPPAALQAKS
jgi:hypothetical protein